MARFQKTVNVWDLTEEQRGKLQPGQWVSAGPNAEHRGRYWGQTRALTDVVAWSGNARGRGWDYHRSLREYARGAAA